MFRQTPHRVLMKKVLRVVAIFAMLALPLMAQSNAGELRLKVTGPDGLPLKVSVQLSSDALQFHRSFSTDDSGLLIARNLPFGPYRLQVVRDSFSSFESRIEIRSVFPTEYVVNLSIASVSSAVNVTAEATLLSARQQMAALVAQSAVQRVTLLLSVGGGFEPLAKQDATP